MNDEIDEKMRISKKKSEHKAKDVSENKNSHHSQCRYHQ